MPSTSDLKRGVRYLFESNAYTVVDVALQTPSARGATTLIKVKARELVTGQLKQMVFKAGERLEDPDVEIVKAQFLYKDGDNMVVMDQDSFEQHELTPEIVGEAKWYLVEDQPIRLVLFNGRPVTIELPKAMDLVIAECDPGFKGDSVNNVMKNATLSTGLQIQVPLFINPGDVVRIDTAEGRYVERVRK
jgi:elongation factor P